MEKVYKFDGDKYTIIRNQDTMSVRCLRHNVPWPAAEADMVGNNLAHWMLNTIDDHEEQLAKQKRINEKLIHMLKFGAISIRQAEADLAMRAGFAAAWRKEDTSDTALDISHGKLMCLDRFCKQVDEVMGETSLPDSQGRSDIDVPALFKSLIQTLEDDGRTEKLEEIKQYLDSVGIHELT